MHAKYEVSTSYDSKVIAKVKVDNRQKKQTNKQTNRQDKNNMPLIIRSGSIKIQRGRTTKYKQTFYMQEYLCNLTKNLLILFHLCFMSQLTIFQSYVTAHTVNVVIFAGGKILRKCWENISRGGNFHDSTPISFIKAYWFNFHMGVIFAKKTNAQKLPHLQ